MKIKNTKLLLFLGLILFLILVVLSLAVLQSNQKFTTNLFAFTEEEGSIGLTPVEPEPTSSQEPLPTPELPEAPKTCNRECSYDARVCKDGLECVKIPGKARKECRNSQCVLDEDCMCSKSVCTQLTGGRGEPIIIKPGDDIGSICSDYCWLTESSGELCPNPYSGDCVKGSCRLSSNNILSCCGEKNKKGYPPIITPSPSPTPDLPN